MTCKLPGLRILGLILTTLVAFPAAGIDVQGRVLEHGSGQPLEGVQVEIRCFEGMRQSGTTKTDDQGAFRLALGSRGRCRIDGHRSGYLRSLMFVPVEGNISILLRMTKGGVIAGRVLSEAGIPVPSAFVVLLDRVSGAPCDLARFVTKSDQEGRYRLFGIPPGTYALGVISSLEAIPVGTDGRVPAASGPTRTVTVNSGEEHPTLDLMVPSTGAGSIVGHVDNATPEVVVLLTLLRRDLPVAHVARTLMDRNGGFRFSTIPSGAYSLFAVAPSLGSGGYAGILGASPTFARTEVEVVMGRQLDVRIGLAPGRTALFNLVGRDEADAPACSRSGTLLLTPVERWGAPVERRANLSGSEPVAVSDLAPGRYFARVTGLPDGCVSSSDTIVDLTSGHLSTTTLQASSASRLRGNMLPVLPAGRRRSLLLLWPFSVDSDGPGLIAIVPDPAGNISADALQPGVYRLVVARGEDWSEPRWQPDSSEMVEIEILSGTTTVEVSTPPHPTLTTGHSHPSLAAHTGRSFRVRLASHYATHY